MASDRDYPTAPELKKIAKWPRGDFKPLMEFVHGIWWMAGWGWAVKRTKTESVYDISTGGWSGNEEIIRAMQSNVAFWAECWVQSRRGGHYRFKVPKANPR